jgi:hypothetical protein
MQPPPRLNPKDLMGMVYDTALAIKERIYGNRIVLFAPLYLVSAAAGLAPLTHSVKGRPRARSRGRDPGAGRRAARRARRAACGVRARRESARRDSPSSCCERPR